MVQDITGAWKQISGNEGLVKAKYGLLPRPTVACMRLVDEDPSVTSAQASAAPSSSSARGTSANEGRFKAHMTAWRYLTTPASTDRIVVEVELDISEGDWYIYIL